MTRAWLFVSVLSLGCGASWEPTDDTQSGLVEDCPDHRHLKVFDGPKSWSTKYGTPGSCVGSHYDCRMPTTDPDFRRYANALDPTDGRWPVASNIAILDGRANPIGTVTATSTKVNFGQRKTLNGKQYVYAFAVDAGPSKLSGWIPAGCVGWDGKTTPDASCVNGSGKTPSDFPVVEGRKPQSSGVLQMRFATTAEIIAAYPMLAGVDPKQVKITCNTAPDLDASIADYLPRLSQDGTFYTLNLVANVPGLHPATGGIAADTFRIAHTENGQVVSDQITFHVLMNVQDLDVFLFAPGSTVGAPEEGAYVAFYYGYVSYPRGDGSWARRYGWVPAIALRKP